jgi:recombinational DNA repair protein (RecF pathway)
MCGVGDILAMLFGLLVLVLFVFGVLNIFGIIPHHCYHCGKRITKIYRKTGTFGEYTGKEVIETNEVCPTHGKDWRNPDHYYD